MAASRFWWYTSGLKYVLQGRINLEGGAAVGSTATPILAYLIGQGYSPLTASDSVLSQITNFQASASATIVNHITLSSLAITQSGVETVKWDAADISGWSSDGSTITSAKYCVLVAQSASSGAGFENLLLGFLDLNADAASSSVGNSTQVNLTWSADGIAKFRANPT